MIIEINNYNFEIEDKIIEAINELIKDFNLESNKQESKFFLYKKEEDYATLGRKVWFDNLGRILIFYNSKEDYFYFESGIDKDLFNQIKPVLDALTKQKFYIELR